MKMIQNCCTSDVAQRANTAQIAAKISTKNIPKAPRTTHKTITTLNADISHNTGCAQCLRVPAISKNAAAMGGPSKIGRASCRERGEVTEGGGWANEKRRTRRR